MARVKGGLGAKKRHNRTLKLAKGYRGARSKQYIVANPAASLTAISANILRLISIPDTFNPCIIWL